MPPVPYATCVPPNGTVVLGRPGVVEQSDLQALLYIVITLLFYSLGIIIGIISYLKREKREMQEDRTFEEYLKMKLDPFVAVKSKRVQQYAERIKFLEEQKRLRDEEAERLKSLSANDALNTTDDRLRRFSRISLLPPDSFSMQFLHKGCQTDDTEKESHSLSSRARKIVKILTPTPSRRSSMIHLPRASKKKVKHKPPEKPKPTLSSLSLPDEDQLSSVSTDTPRQRSPSFLTPTICLPNEDMTSRSTLSESPQSCRRSRSPVPYMDVSTDDDTAVEERAVTPLLHE